MVRSSLLGRTGVGRQAAAAGPMAGSAASPRSKSEREESTSGETVSEGIEPQTRLSAWASENASGSRSGTLAKVLLLHHQMQFLGFFKENLA